MNILLVDDEALARARLRRLLGRLEQPVPARIDEAADAAGARALLACHGYDVVLLDIQMPGDSGLRLAAELELRAAAPAVVFVTAHDQHALSAFEHGAYDYLTKPVALERLRQALARVSQRRAARAPDGGAPDDALSIVERGALLRVPLAEILYFRAQDKYTLVRTASRSYLAEPALGELEQRYGARYVRAHRGVLVAVQAIASLERAGPAPGGARPDPAEGAEGPEGAEGSEWQLRLRGVPERLPVSRRQLALLRALLRQG